MKICRAERFKAVRARSGWCFLGPSVCSSWVSGYPRSVVETLVGVFFTSVLGQNLLEPEALFQIHVDLTYPTLVPVFLHRSWVALSTKEHCPLLVPSVLVWSKMVLRQGGREDSQRKNMQENLTVRTKHLKMIKPTKGFKRRKSGSAHWVKHDSGRGAALSGRRFGRGQHLYWKPPAPGRKTWCPPVKEKVGTSRHCWRDVRLGIKSWSVWAEGPVSSICRRNLTNCCQIYREMSAMERSRPMCRTPVLGFFTEKNRSSSCSRVDEEVI